MKKLFIIVAVCFGLFLIAYEFAPSDRVTLTERDQVEYTFTHTGTSVPSTAISLQNNLLEQNNHLIACRIKAGYDRDQGLSDDCKMKQMAISNVLYLEFRVDVSKDLLPKNQYDIFYGINTASKPHISQPSTDHYKANRLLSTDVATGKREKIYAMDCQLELCEWTVSKEDGNLGKGDTVVLINQSRNMRFEYGHTRLTTAKTTVKTGEEVGEMLCPGDVNSGMTTGCHVDFSYWTMSNGQWKQTEYMDDSTYDPDKRINELLKSKEEHIEQGQVYFTTYNGECNQTKGGVISNDGNCYGSKTAPCAVGKNAGNTSGLCGSPFSTVTGANLKEMYLKGENPIALTRDLIEGDPSTGYCSKNCPFKFWDKVLVTPVNNWQKPYTAIVVDAKAKKFIAGGDQFHLDKKNNNSYYASVTKYKGD